ncbi:MAG TPA: GDP-L-fucose synthase [Actinomycetota bacterium]|nr:GDP-L-fucose synthase [Actinomycetota bacterium]
MEASQPSPGPLVGARVMVTGGGGFLGRRIVAELEQIEAVPVPVRSSDYDLRQPEEVRRALKELDCAQVIHAAAVVGGIGANREHPAAFFYENAVMGLHLVHEAYGAGIDKLLVVGTACSYPKLIPTPFKEEQLWDGYPEETNAPYGLAKKMILAQGQAYRDEYGFDFLYVIPTNLYGPGDNFDLQTSHVIPAMIRKFVEAKESGRDEVVLWGTGEPSREFLFVDDAARGIVQALAGLDTSDPVNLGVAAEVKIKDLVALIRDATGYEGEIVWDTSYPDGQPRRSLDGSRASKLLGWKPRMPLEKGLTETVEWYLKERDSQEL